MQRVQPTLSPHLPNAKMLAVMLQVIVITFIFEAHCHKVHGSTIPSSDGNLNSEGMDSGSMNMDGVEKRRWQSLQGGWGKRNWNTQDLGPPDTDEDAEGEEVIFPNRWVPLLLANGDRYDPQTKYSVVYVANAQTNPRPHELNDDNDLLAAVNKALDVDTETTIDEDALLSKTNKRSWKSMNVAWGKRRNAPTWNKFRGAWGKREPGWNNLKGMWGKRTAKDWQKLYNGWGKRSLN